MFLIKSLIICFLSFLLLLGPHATAGEENRWLCHTCFCREVKQEKRRLNPKLPPPPEPQMFCAMCTREVFAHAGKGRRFKKPDSDGVYSMCVRMRVCCMHVYVCYLRVFVCLLYVCMFECVCVAY